jgi:hypothetical protein
MKKSKLVFWLLAALLATAGCKPKTEPAAEEKAPTKKDTAEKKKKKSKPLETPKELVTREILLHSLEIGTQFLVEHQKEAGNFTYIYDWVNKKYDNSDNQVRQAGVTWALALIYNNSPNPKVEEALKKALGFFEKDAKSTEDGKRYPVYPSTKFGKTGTLALVALSLIDYLRAAQSTLDPQVFSKYKQQLDGYLKLLASIQTDDGLWYGGYDYATGKGIEKSSPYSDGEALLALVKAAKYLGYKNLIPQIMKAADAGHKLNVAEALKTDPDSKTTKGYYQWSSMAFYEMATSGWPDTEKWGNYVIEMADWMIDVHGTLQRTKNTGYAYEGIIHAYELARIKGDTEHMEKFKKTVAIGLSRLTSWQVGSKVANSYIQSHKPYDSKSIGGAQDKQDEPTLRIDMTQHQMHAAILALRYIYKREA